MTKPLVTVAIPSFNQGRFLDAAIASVFNQNIPVEVFVLDGGSTDNSVEVIKKWESKIVGWRSHLDTGQAAAINEGVIQGCAPYVCWLNSDDWFLPLGLERLICAIEMHPKAPAVYGKALNYNQKKENFKPVWVETFNEERLATRCIISQPATLIRRDSWEKVGGVDESLHMAIDYDLWWRLFKSIGPLIFVDDVIAVNRNHEATKTNSHRRLHYIEAMSVVKKYNRRLPLKWWLAQPYSVWFKSFLNRK